MAAELAFEAARADRGGVYVPWAVLAAVGVASGCGVCAAVVVSLRRRSLSLRSRSAALAHGRRPVERNWAELCEGPPVPGASVAWA